MTTNNTPATELHLNLLCVNDPRIGKVNTLCRQISSTPGLVRSGESMSVVPSQYFQKEGFATITLTSAQMMQLLRQNPFAIICEPDREDTTVLPQICQRVPDRVRRNGIREAWGDPTRTPTNKHETLEIAMFGARVDATTGIQFGGESLAILTDGAGRTSAAIDEILENQGRILTDRAILWTLNFDVSGKLSRQVMNFLSHNRDAKRISRGTTASVENLLLTELARNGVITAPNSFAEKLAKTYVVRHLYDFPVNGSLTELFPWGYEGRKSTSTDFQGKGRASSIVTAIGSLAHVLDRAKIKPKQLPAILDFAYRVWYRKCPTSVLDAHRDAVEPGYKSKTRLHTTLAAKVITYVSVRAYLHTGINEETFAQTCERIIHHHWENHKSDYGNSKAKKMTMDRFWQESTYFSDLSRFNSGAVNTITLLNELAASCDTICGPMQAASRTRRTTTV